MSRVGAVAWGVVPHVPEPPFRLYAGTEVEPITVPDAATLVEPARVAPGADAEHSYVVGGKIRPVLVVSDVAEPPFFEVLALRLQRLSRLMQSEHARIRRQADPALFHLSPDRFPGLEESAANIATLVRVHRDALDERSVEGRLDASELRAVHERLVRHYRFDLHDLLVQAIGRLRQSP